MKNRTKIDENGIKNPSKINENKVHGGVLGRLWGSLGSCWLKVMSLGPILTGFFFTFSLQDGSWMSFGVDLGAKLGPSWDKNRLKAISKK